MKFAIPASSKHTPETEAVAMRLSQQLILMLTFKNHYSDSFPLYPSLSSI